MAMKLMKNKRCAEEIEIRQIAITQPIISAIHEIDPDFDLSKFKKSDQPHGFRLPRMERMMEADLNSLLQQEPVEVVKAKSMGRTRGVNIDGVTKILYDIVNGRHRVARAIIDKKPTINVEFKD
jgi:hypothetical protein